jgi:hypothetical protein
MLVKILKNCSSIEIKTGDGKVVIEEVVKWIQTELH